MNSPAANTVNESCEFAWIVVEQCKNWFSSVFLHFFASHQGKGWCDGAFGLQRKWLRDWEQPEFLGTVYAYPIHDKSFEQRTEQIERSVLAAERGLKRRQNPEKVLPKDKAAKKEDNAKVELPAAQCVFQRAAAGHVREYNSV